MFKSPGWRAGVIALAFAASASMMGVAQAQTPTKLVSAQPAPNSNVSSPQAILLKFSEQISKPLSSITLTDARANTVATMQMPAPDAQSLSLMPNQTLAPGQYTISWTAVGPDGHKETGTYHFTVK